MQARTIDWTGFTTFSGRRGYIITIMNGDKYEALETGAGTFKVVMPDGTVKWYRGDVQPSQICNDVLDALTR